MLYVMFSVLQPAGWKRRKVEIERNEELGEVSAEIFMEMKI